MKNFWIGVITGTCIGTAAAWIYLDRLIQTGLPNSLEVVRDIQNVPSYSAEDTAAHRTDRFESLKSIEDVMSLPTRFDRREALYAIAGRSDSAQLQHLIEQSNRIADASSRSASLSVLFNRLTVVDPHTAIAIASGPSFASDPRVTYAVWFSWSKRDLNEALTAANAMPSMANKIAAADALYRAYGNLGSAETKKIESTLGIPPSNAIKTRYLETLASESPEKAINYISKVLPPSEQRAAVAALGKYFARTNPQQTESFKNLLSSERLQKSYESAFMSTLAQSDPRQLLDSKDAKRHGKAQRSAIEQLAKIDINEATAYFAAETDPKTRLNLASGITRALARIDPYQAIDWARNNDESGKHKLLERAVMAIVEDHPQIALAEVANVGDEWQRNAIAAKVIEAIAKTDPAFAAAALEQPLDGPHKTRAATRLIPLWAKKDPAAATAWVMQIKSQMGSYQFQSMADRLIRIDPDTAIKMLPGLDRATADDWLVKIATSVARTKSQSETMEFIDQYRNSPNFSKLQSVVIPLVANEDVETATQMANRMAAGKNRDKVFAHLVSTTATKSPAAAAAMLNKIQGERARGSAAQSLVHQWTQSDPNAAHNWVNTLREGKMRDDAIVALLSSNQELNDVPMSLINSVSSDSARSQAKLAYIFGMSRNGRAEMEAAVNKLSLNDAERLVVDMFIESVTPD